MTVEVPITQDESEEIEALYYIYKGYLDILDYLVGQCDLSPDNPTLNKKFEDAAALFVELERQKRITTEKYRPEGEWPFYVFDFDRHTVVYSNEQ